MVPLRRITGYGFSREVCLPTQPDPDHIWDSHYSCNVSPACFPDRLVWRCDDACKDVRDVFITVPPCEVPVLDLLAVHSRVGDWDYRDTHRNFQQSEGVMQLHVFPGMQLLWYVSDDECHQTTQLNGAPSAPREESFSRIIADYFHRSNSRTWMFTALRIKAGMSTCAAIRICRSLSYSCAWT